MSICEQCQTILSRVILYQLGKTTSISILDSNFYKHGAVRIHLKHARTCLVCRVFRDYLLESKSLEVRRTIRFDSNDYRHAGAAYLDLFGSSKNAKDVGLVVSLVNGRQLCMLVFACGPLVCGKRHLNHVETRWISTH